MDHCDRSAKHPQHRWLLHRQAVTCPGTPEFSVDDLFAPEPPVVAEHELNVGDEIELRAKVTRSLGEGRVLVQYAGTANEHTLVRNATIYRTVRKPTPGERAYKRAMALRPGLHTAWAELPAGKREEWESIARAARDEEG